MNVCDKCKKNPAELRISFKTKSFDLCNSCALKIVGWIEAKPFKEKLKELYDISFKTGYGVVYK